MRGALLALLLLGIVPRSGAELLWWDRYLGSALP
jgi:hypothetical protein